MKRFNFVFVIVILIFGITLSSCQRAAITEIPIPFNTETTTITTQSPDDIVITPGGTAYRANVQQAGMANPWPPIQTVEVQLGSSSDSIIVTYRNNIVTAAGQTRNNIIGVRKNGGTLEGGGISSMQLYASGNTGKFQLSQKPGAGLIGTLAEILVIEIPNQDIKPGKYKFGIGIKVLDKDYGTVPCTVELIQ